MNNPRLDYLREKSHKLPKLPGVYIMRDKSNKVIYVGKAKALKNRVSSYFMAVESHSEKVYKTVENIYDFDYIVTDSEFEALVLECSMIKQYNPKYNILLKDDKGYHYIKIYPNQWPKITAAMQKVDDKGIYLGPYLSQYVVTQTVEQANKAFQLPTCNRKFPQDLGKGRPCLNYHIKQCMGVCRGKIGEKAYREIVDSAVDFIKGGSTEAINRMTGQMQQAAEDLNFEKAASIRDKIAVIKKINDQQKVIFAKASEQDTIAFVRGTNETVAIVLKFREERLVDKLEFFFNGCDDLISLRTEFLLQFYTNKRDIPRLIELDGECEDLELIAKLLSEKADHTVHFKIPQRGEKLKLVEMAKNNGAEQLAMRGTRSGHEVSALDELAKLLGLERPPQYIEAYDISNIGTDIVVGGMIVFENGRPLRSGYRKFNIKTVVGIDDYSSMAEVITRRFDEYKKRHETEKDGFARLPDLILLDGGKGHLSVVQKVLDQLGIAVPVFGMVKDDKHHTRAITKQGGEIAINSTRKAFTLVSKIQDEVHRFTITTSRAKHQKTAFALALTQVEGIGETRAAEIYRHFKTVKAMKQATIEQLSKVKGMNKPTAEKLYTFLHEEK